MYSVGRVILSGSTLGGLLLPAGPGAQPFGPRLQMEVNLWLCNLLVVVSLFQLGSPLDPPGLFTGITFDWLPESKDIACLRKGVKIVHPFEIQQYSFKSEQC